MHWQDNVELEYQSQNHGQNMTVEQAVEAVREKVKARSSILNKVFIEIDFAHIGSVAKEDFQDVLNKHVMRLSQDQVFTSSAGFYHL